MEYGSIFGHGAYLGPDFTADYLHRPALIANGLNGSFQQTTQESTVADFKANWYDATSGILTYSVAQTEAFNKLVLQRQHWLSYGLEKSFDIPLSGIAKPSLRFFFRPGWFS